MTTLAQVFGYGLLSARPAAGAEGRQYYATDTSLLYRDNGSGWDTLSTSGLTNPMTTAGDIIVGGASGTPGRLAIGATGTALVGGTTPAWAFPPGYELDYIEYTSPVSITATTEGTANTVVTGSSVAYDGSTIIIIEFFSPGLQAQATAAASLNVILLEDSTVLGEIAIQTTPAANTNRAPCLARLRRTPSNASHTYTVKAFTSSGTSTVNAGAGGSGAFAPGYIRVTKA